MTTLFYKALSQADKLPVIHQANQWWFSSKEEEAQQQQVEETTTAYNLSTPRYSIAPPPYEKVVSKEESRNFLSSIWKRASFSSSYNEEEETLLQLNDTKVDKQMVDHAITLIQVATEMKNSNQGQNQQMAIDLYMMGLDKLITALPSMCIYFIIQ